MKMGRLSVLLLPLALYSVQCGIIQVGFDDAVQHVFTHNEAESYKTLYVEGDYLYIGAVSLPQEDGPGYLFKVDKNNINDTTPDLSMFDVEDDPSTGAIPCRIISPLNKGATLSGIYKCPPKNDQRVASVFGNDNQLYSATTYSDGTSIIARFPTSSDPLDLQTENDAKWLKNPEFISTYRVTPTAGEAEILIFFREEGEENINQYPQKLTYSRVARVCEVDEGGNTNVLTNRWATYLKARLDCSATNTEFPDFEQFYDVLEDTEFVAGGIDGGTVYAVFTANRNGESMSALCSYSVDAMPNVFDSNKYWHQDYTDDVWNKVEPSFSPRPGECVADSTFLGDDILDALKEHPQMEPLIPSQTPPLLTSYTGVKFTQIISTTVDSELILYIGTDRGAVLKVLYNGGQPVVLEEVQVCDDVLNPEPVTAVAKSDEFLYIGFNDKVVQVPMYQCHRFIDCNQCNGAGDPHCGWDESSGQCLPGISPGACSTSSPVAATFEVLYGDVSLASCSVRNGKWYHESTKLTIDNVKYTVIDGLGLLVADFRFDDNGVYTMKSDAGAELCVRRLETYPTIFLEPNTTSQHAVVCDGKDLYFYCRAKGPSDLTITWHGPDDSELSDCDGVNLNGNTGGNFESIVWCKAQSASSDQTFTCRAGPRSSVAERVETMVTVKYEDCILDEEEINRSMEWEVQFHYHMKEMAQWEDDIVNSGTCQYDNQPFYDVDTCDCYCEDP
ncbi:semaphorin-4E-like isoform X2 [Ptychodera flava]|uniref:semaphorin-4E-like isoform X2 n=1 Tax=Ptychodera flava TaxID=63121 RepID=UPI003969E41C